MDILNSLDPEATCNCTEIGQKISTVLDRGLSELNNKKDPNDNILLEILDYLAPFTDVFIDQPAFRLFYSSAWNLENHPKLYNKLAISYPFYLTDMLDNIFKNLAIFESRKTYQKLNRICINSKESFNVAINYIADNVLEKGFTNDVEKFMKVFLSDIRMEIPSYRDMYPEHLEPYWTLLEETENPYDKGLLKELKWIKQRNQRDFVILVTHYPKFSHLLNEF